MPPVSTSSTYRSCRLSRWVTRSRVTPEVGSTMAMRRPASQLKRLDLPTFGRPTITTCGIPIETLARTKSSPPPNGVGQPMLKGQPMHLGSIIIQGLSGGQADTGSGFRKARPRLGWIDATRFDTCCGTVSRPCPRSDRRPPRTARSGPLGSANRLGGDLRSRQWRGPETTPQLGSRHNSAHATARAARFPSLPTPTSRAGSQTPARIGTDRRGPDRREPDRRYTDG